MEDVLSPVRRTQNVQNGIQKFESLSLEASSKPQSKESKPSKLVIDLDERSADEPALKAISTKKTVEPHSTAKSGWVASKAHSKRDSTAFLRQSYLAGPQSAPTSGASLADDAKEILKSQPNNEDLKAVLAYLHYGVRKQHDFNVRITSPMSAQIINILVTTTIPDIWPNLRQNVLSEDEAEMRNHLLACLKSPAGVSALVAHTRNLTAHTSNTLNTVPLLDTVSVLAQVLKGSRVVSDLLQDMQDLYDQNIQRHLFWQELNSLIPGGRVLGTVAQALSKISSTKETLSHVAWLGDGQEFSKWLAKNISTAAIKIQTTDTSSWEYLGSMLKRSLSLGHKDVVISEIYSSLLLGRRALWTPLHQLLKNMSALDQTFIFDSILFDLSRKSLGTLLPVSQDLDENLEHKISSVAALIAGLITNNEILEEHLEEWLVVTNAGYASVGFALRRSLIAVLAKSEDKLERVLAKALSNFSDKLQIHHASSLQQDACTETILLAIGYLERTNLQILKRPHISSLVMRSISNRLAASIPHVRFLGMIVGVAMSRAVDDPDKVLNFGVEEVEGDEAQTWLSIPQLSDAVADQLDVDALFSITPYPTGRSKSKKKRHVSKRTRNPTPRMDSKIISIEEVSDQSPVNLEDEEDSDLIPYSKPDSDPSDSEEDSTLINRSKPSAPVYISSLTAQLQDSNLDVVELALQNAPSLIRRKTGFGSELADGINPLTSALLNMQEGMSDSDLAQLRADSLIACVLARPEVIAPFLASSYFQGDFSMFQRVTILTVLGLSARELAGFRDNVNETDTSSKKSKNKSSLNDNFPSKRLPSHLQPQITSHSSASHPSTPTSTQLSLKPLLTSSSNPISALTLSQAQSIIQPMAMSAADKLSGPSILKVESSRTFSSRMAIETQRKKDQEQRTKIIPKNLHNLLAKKFYLELCSKMGLVLSISSSTSSTAGLGGGSGSGNTTTLKTPSTITSPNMLALFLQTLTLILNTLGPSAASVHLPTLTQETLLLLLPLHNISTLSTDPVVLPAMLHLLLALLDITIEAGVSCQERLITDHGVGVSELIGWVGGLSDVLSENSNYGAADATDRDGSVIAIQWNILAAGIQVKWFEIGQRFQGRMFGLKSVDDDI